MYCRSHFAFSFSSHHTDTLPLVDTSAGDYTCHAKKANCSGACNVGSLGHYEQDAATFARWGLDFVKMVSYQTPAQPSCMLALCLLAIAMDSALIHPSTLSHHCIFPFCQ